MPANAAQTSVGTLYDQPLVHSLMLFITLPAVMEIWRKSEKFLKGMKSDHLQQKENWTVPEFRDTAGLCNLENIIVCEFLWNISVAGRCW